MFGFFGLQVVETPETIIVKNINGHALGRFITTFWKTSVIEKYMFKKVTGGRFGQMEFYKFFTLDVIYMLEKLSEKRNGSVPARTLHQIVELLKQNTWYKDTQKEPSQPRLDFKKLDLFNYKPLPHQQGFLDYYNKIPTQYHLNGALLSAAPGSGKSASNLMTMTIAGVDKIIIVSPKIAVINVWETDINKHFKNPPKYWHSRMNNEPNGDEKIFIYHYEALDKAFGHFDKYIKTNNVGLVLDESHNLNDIKAQRTQNWLNLVKHTGTQNVIHASGTPLKALGSEAIPLLRAIDPMFTPKAEEAFKKIYGSDGKRGLDILRNRLGLISYTTVKSELGLAPPEMLTLPVKTPNAGNFTLTKVREAMKKFMEERYKYYKSREKEDINFYRECLAIHASKLRGKEVDTFDYYKACVRRIQATTEYSMVKEEISFCKRYEFTEISKNLPQSMVKPFRSVCSVIKYLPLKIQGECLGNIVGKMRIQAHVEMCAHIPFFDICESTKKKTVVFTSFVDVLETAFNACKEKGLDPILVYGKTSQNIAGIVKAFGGDEKVNPLIATYDSLSTAVPLTMADTMIMINAPFRAYIQDQAISRIHRLNQDSQTRVYQCFLDTGNESNISSRSLDIMKWSQQMVEEMTGVKSPYNIEDAADGSIKVSSEGLDDSLDYVLSLEQMTQPKTIDVKSTTTSSRYQW